MILIDEPTAHLDLQYQVGLLEIVSDLAYRENLAVLIALHDLNLAARYGDRVALLVRGAIKALGTSHKVITSALLSEAYSLPIKVVDHPFLSGLIVLPESQNYNDG